MKTQKPNLAKLGHFITAALLCAIIITGCKKDKNGPIGCGCTNGDIKGYVTYKEFGNHNYNAWLLYVRENNQNAWFLSVEIPNSNYGAICKICNPGLPAIRKYTDTSRKEIGIPVKVAGTVRDLCSGEDGFGFTVIPETVVGYITIDSLTQK